MDAQADSETEFCPNDLQTIYRSLFGPPAVERKIDRANLRDELDAYAIVRAVAQEYPAVARTAVLDETASQYRGEHPFDYPIYETRVEGEEAR